MSDQSEPMWDEAAGPRWDDNGFTPAGAPAPMTTQDDDGLSWESGPDEDDSDEPPVSHFYKPRSSAPAAPAESSAPMAQPSPSPVDEFASDTPTFAQDGPQSPAGSPGAVETDDDGLQWDSEPLSQPQAGTSATEDASAVDEGFAPEHADASGSPVSEEPMWAEDAPGAEPVGARGNTGHEQSVPSSGQTGATKEGSDVGQVPEYTGMPSHDDDPAPTGGAKPSTDTAAPKSPKRTPGAQSEQGHTPSTASTPDASAPETSAPGKGTTASAAKDAGEGTERESGDSGKAQGAKKPQRKTSSRSTPKARGKRNASDDWQ